MAITAVSIEDKEWWKSHLADTGTSGQIDKSIKKMPQSFDVSRIFSIMMGLIDDSIPPELPQVEFTILQNWMQIAVVFTQQADNQLVKNYAAVIAYNSMMTEKKRRELYQFLTEYFLEHKLFSLVIQQPQQIERT
jgi:hypothetical protein